MSPTTGSLRGTRWLRQDSSTDVLFINDLEAPAAGVLITSHGEFGLTVKTVDELGSSLEFALQSAKYGVHQFSFGGGKVLEEQPADVWDKLTRKPPIQWIKSASTETNEDDLWETAALVAAGVVAPPSDSGISTKAYATRDEIADGVRRLFGVEGSQDNLNESEREEQKSRLRALDASSFDRESASVVQRVADACRSGRQADAALRMWEVIRRDATALDLHAMLTEGMCALPLSLMMYTHLTSLVISSCGLSTLPEHIGAFHSLTALDASDNHLTVLPSSASRLIHLETFVLSANYFTSAGSILHAAHPMTKLRLLSLADNLLTDLGGADLPALPPSLKQLDLATNQMSQLPACLTLHANALALSALNVSHNPLAARAALPASMASTIGTSLITIELCECRLTVLPNAITTLPILSSLHIDANQLTNLPKDTANLHPSLTCLSIASNRLAVLPEVITALTALCTLNVASNQITTLPSTIRLLTRLTNLDMASNSLAALPPSLGQLGRLTRLALDENYLNAIPSSIAQLPDTCVITARDNPLQLPPVAVLDYGMAALRDFVNGAGEGAPVSRRGTIVMVTGLGSGRTDLLSAIQRVAGSPAPSMPPPKGGMSPTARMEEMTGMDLDGDGIVGNGWSRHVFDASAPPGHKPSSPQAASSSPRLTSGGKGASREVPTLALDTSYITLSSPDAPSSSPITADNSAVLTVWDVAASASNVAAAQFAACHRFYILEINAVDVKTPSPRHEAARLFWLNMLQVPLPSYHLPWSPPGSPPHPPSHPPRGRCTPRAPRSSSSLQTPRCSCVLQLQSSQSYQLLRTPSQPTLPRSRRSLVSSSRSYLHGRRRRMKHWRPPAQWHRLR